MTLEYTIDVDYHVWIPVPLEFPWNGYDTAMAWAADLTADLLPGPRIPHEVKSAFAATALERAVMEPPLPEAIERFWRRPDTGAPDRLVHLYAIESDETAAEELVEVARIGIGGFVQGVAVLEDTAFTTALRVTLLLELPDDVVVSVTRFIGSRDGTVLVLELIDDDIGAVGFLEPEMETLFRRIRLRTA
ncbi:hypothetical protein [Microbacterium sp. CFBP9034]|uniref:hypothetical protein n=1 Tax=Microbacterium sp. CFBP9034 TaxID=3096540 RepID=UPI002A6AA2B3|nr:hypothetical protein [Microbacterium sp. CFBP9034]MDY0908374.1 hypothetical protein [Microbacterium sp. CFBP9034]